MTFSYWWTLAFLACTALLVATIGGEAFVWLTLGIGFPFLLSSTFLAYLLCASPAVLLWNEGRHYRLYGVAAALSAAAVLALLPGLLASRDTRVLAEPLIANDITLKSRPIARSIEIVTPRFRNGGKPRPVGCTRECHSLLLAGHVDWVRIAFTAGGDKSSVNLFRRGEGTACSNQGSPCVVRSADTSEDADIRITIERERPETKREHGLVAVRLLRVLTVLHGRDVIMRRTEVVIERPVIPTIIKFAADDKGGLLLRKQASANAIDLDHVLAELGFVGSGSVAPAPPPQTSGRWRHDPNGPGTHDLQAVLALPQSEPFNEEQYSVIDRWLSSVRWIGTRDNPGITWSDRETQLVRSILHDPRLQRASFIDQVVMRREIRADLLPDVIDLLSSRGVGNGHTPLRSLAFALQRIDPSELAPYADRILAASERDPATRSALLGVVSRLPVNPLPRLLPFEADYGPGSQHVRIKAACRAQKTWAPQIVPELRSALERQGEGSYLREYRRAVLSALINLGDLPWVEQQLRAGRFGDKDLLTDLKRSHRYGWLC
jgi:hypothetical protein